MKRPIHNIQQQIALPGFTFMEMIVVVALFGVLTMATSDIFMRTSRTQRKTAALQRLQDDARYLTQKIASEVQAGTIDFSAYANAQSCNEDLQSAIQPVNGNDMLAVRRFDGMHLYIKKMDENCADEKSAPCLGVSDDGTSWSAASSRGVKVESLLFYIYPDKDPFTYCDSSAAYLRDIQPRVTVAMTASAAVAGTDEPTQLSIQTTIASREYKR